MTDLFPTSLPKPEYMRGSPDTGARKVYLVVGILVAIEILILLGYFFRIGSDKLAAQSVRLTLTLGLGYALIRRQEWARWTWLLLLVIGLWNGGGRWLFVWRNGNALGIAAYSALMTGYIIAARTLLWSDDLHAYMDSGEEKASP